MTRRFGFAAVWRENAQRRMLEAVRANRIPGSYLALRAKTKRRGARASPRGRFRTELRKKRDGEVKSNANDIVDP